MRRPWIKVETATPDKPEICAIASRLRMDEDMVVGKLIRLWSWVALNRVNGNDLGVTLEFIDKLVGRKGFSAALCQAGWLIERDGKLSLPNFDRHNSDIAKTRALTSQRVARHRVAKSLEPTEGNINVTESAPSPIVEQDKPSKSEAPQEEQNSPIEEALDTESINSVTTAADEAPPPEEPEEDLEDVLSINAQRTFKPLHSESALAEAMAIEDPAPQPEVEPPALPVVENSEPTPTKKARRKTDNEVEEQPMLF